MGEGGKEQMKEDSDSKKGKEVDNFWDIWLVDSTEIRGNQTEVKKREESSMTVRGKGASLSLHW